MEHLPIHNITVEQARMIDEHCAACPFWVYRATYDFDVYVCEKHGKTDSAIFRVNRCEELRRMLGL